MKSKYNVGDTVYVVACINGHEFEIGQEVTIYHMEMIRTHQGKVWEYSCKKGKEYWYLTDE